VATTRPGMRALLFFGTAILIAALLAAVYVYSPRESVLPSPHLFPSPPPQAIPDDANSLDERNHTPGVLRSEIRMNRFGGPQKPRAPNGIREPVRATRTLPRPSHDVAQLVSAVTGI
jgi:hypothetical protein